MPFSDSPPSKITVGADKYPVPGSSNTTRFTFPLLINALATAPVPLSLMIFTSGAIIYPVPPLFKTKSTISKEALSSQNFQGYSLIFALSENIFPSLIVALINPIELFS